MNWPRVVIHKESGELFISTLYHLSASCTEEPGCPFLLIMLSRTNIFGLMTEFNFDENFESLSEL